MDSLPLELGTAMTAKVGLLVRNSSNLADLYTVVLAASPSWMYARPGGGAEEGTMRCSVCSLMCSAAARLNPHCSGTAAPPPVFPAGAAASFRRAERPLRVAAAAALRSRAAANFSSSHARVCAAPHVRVGKDSGSRRKGAGAYREKEARSILPRKWIRRARPCPRTGSWWSSTTRLRCYNACSVPSTSIGARAPAVDEGGDGSALSPHSIG